MLDWDRIVFLVLSVPLAAYQGYVGWQLWQKAKYDAALGSCLLAIVSVAFPLALAMTGE